LSADRRGVITAVTDETIVVDGGRAITYRRQVGWSMTVLAPHYGLRRALFSAPGL